MGKKQKNIVLIMTDQMRGDCLGCAGHPDVKTPYLDTLAAKGVRFDHAYSSCPSCIPARAALHTGMAQESHGRVGYADGVRWEYPHTLAGELAKAGYYTQCVGKMHVHPLRSLQGFHHIELHDGYLHYYRNPDIPSCENQKFADDYFYWLKKEKGVDADVTDTGLECNSWVSRPWMYAEELHPTNWVSSRCLDFLRRRDRDKPFFLMASYLRPHPPFDAPQHYFDLYREKTLRRPASDDWRDPAFLQEKGRTFDSDTGPADEELVRQAQIGYYACVTHLDHQIGRLIQELVEQQIYEDTLILFTSDHGELLCDHQMSRKSRAYEGSACVPLILSGGGLECARPGMVSEALAELRDVMPTLLDWAGVRIPDSVDGVSLLPACRKTAGKAGTDDAAACRRAESDNAPTAGNDAPACGHSAAELEGTAEEAEIFRREWLHGEHEMGAASSHWIVTPQDKYVWLSQTGEEQYFDLLKDRRETHNGIGDAGYQARIEKLRGWLMEALAGREEGFVKDGRLVVGRPLVSCLGTKPEKQADL